MINLVIADDEPLALHELRSLIRDSGTDFRITGEFRNGRKVLEFLMDHPETDLAILDINMPGLSGLEIMEQRNRQITPIDYIVVSAYSDYHLVRKAFKLGITDFIIKQELEKENLNPLLERVKERITRRNKRSGPFIPSTLDGEGKALLHFLKSGERPEGLIIPEGGTGQSCLLKMEILPCVPHDLDLSAEALLRLLCDRVQQSFAEFDCFMEGDDFFLILFFEQEGEMDEVIGFSENLRRLVKQYFNRTMVVSPSVVDAHETLPVRFKNIKELHSLKCKTIRCCMEHLRQHYRDQDIRLENLCTLTGTSRSYLSSLFKQETGLGFREYLNELRIGQAISLLDKGEMQIQVIAESVGFSNVEHFSRTFKHRTGLSPRMYLRGK